MEETVDEEIVVVVFYCNISFNFIEFKLFTNLVQSLRPGYKPPTRKAVNEEHLNSVSKLQHKIKDVLDGKAVTLLEDRWSNMHNLAARCVVFDGKAYYLDADESSSMSVMAENCFVLCRNAIDRAEAMYNRKVKNVITNNAKNIMFKASNVHQRFKKMTT